MLATRKDLDQAMETVHAVFSGTAQYSWPLLNKRCGTEVIVKHENHSPVGAFKYRGGLVYMKDLAARVKSLPDFSGVITATRGNHGQSISTAAGLFGIDATIVVPEGNSQEKNAAMEAQGGRLLIRGDDFQAAADAAKKMAIDEGLMMLPSFDPLLVHGVATYAMELFAEHNDLDTVYVPIGMGSGVCAVITARDVLGLKTKVVGVVAKGASAYAQSFEAGKIIDTDEALTFADGVACRAPVQDALDIILAGADRVISVSDDQIKTAMRAYFTDTHNVAEGAGAVPLAGLLSEREQMKGKKTGLILTGGNIDAPDFADIIKG